MTKSCKTCRRKNWCMEMSRMIPCTDWVERREDNAKGKHIEISEENKR